MLSVVIPAYNEQAMIEKTAQTVSQILEKEQLPYEIVFVNDGSKDDTWNQIQKVHANNPHILGVNFSRNFGKEAAVLAGLSSAKGDAVVVMDCDLQHPPVKIIEMEKLWEQGYEVVEGIKEERGEESTVHKMAANTFYSMISKATGIDMSNASDFKLLDKKAVNALLAMPEHHSFFRALSSWVGFKTTQVYYKVEERTAGESKWSTKALIEYALTNISSFTAFPMQMVTILGVIMLVVSILLTIIALFQKLENTAAAGFTTVIILLCFCGSIIMISLGIMGYYISKIYDEVKGRPRYIISEKTESSL